MKLKLSVSNKKTAVLMGKKRSSVFLGSSYIKNEAKVNSLC